MKLSLLGRMGLKGSFVSLCFWVPKIAQNSVRHRPSCFRSSVSLRGLEVFGTSSERWLALPTISWPFRDDGIVNPDSKYERFRRDEYSDPFYQWWYFWVRDTETGDNWAITYMYVSQDGIFEVFGAGIAW